MKAETLPGVSTPGAWLAAAINDMGLHGQIGFGEVSAARVFLVGIDKFGMLGVRTVMDDGLGGFGRVLELTSAISPVIAEKRTEGRSSG